MLKMNIEKLLEEKGKKKSWLADEVGMTHANMHNLVTNKTTAIRYENLAKICKALDCSINDLFIQVEDPKKDEDDDDYWL